MIKHFVIWFCALAYYKMYRLEMMWIVGEYDDRIRMMRTMQNTAELGMRSENCLDFDR